MRSDPVLSEQGTACSLKLDDLGFEREELERRAVWKVGLLISRRTVVLLFRLGENRWYYLYRPLGQCATRNRRRFARNVVGINALCIP